MISMEIYYLLLRNWMYDATCALCTNRKIVIFDGIIDMTNQSKNQPVHSQFNNCLDDKS